MLESRNIDLERSLDHSDCELTSYKNGSLYKQHSLFSKEICLQIKLFYDELETVDAIGFKSGKHKLAGFYYTINDTPVDSHSRLEDIYVAILVKSALV